MALLNDTWLLFPPLIALLPRQIHTNRKLFLLLAVTSGTATQKSMALGMSESGLGIVWTGDGTVLWSRGMGSRSSWNPQSVLLNFGRSEWLDFS